MNENQSMMSRLCRSLAILAIMAMLGGPAAALADEYGVGSEDFIVDDTYPDLLSDDEFDEFADEEEVYDPLEPLNRASFVFNDKLYFWLLKPVKEGYSYVVPQDIRMVLGNFFFNLGAPGRLINNVLQGRFEDAGVVALRFLINTTYGIYGFGDVAAQEFDLEPKRADLGQTFGVWGVGEGLYLVWPVFGPSNLRDSVGLVGDWQLHPYTYAGLDGGTQVAAFGTEFINTLSITPDVYEEMKRISLDPYIATRKAYFDYRTTFIESHKE
jgi:phospholipid-binding lipoprotein MlaA